MSNVPEELSVWTKKLLEDSYCSCEDCRSLDQSVLFFRSECHPRAGFYVRYTKGTDYIDLLCVICGLPVARVAVK